MPPRVIVTYPLPEAALRPLSDIAELHVLGSKDSLTNVALECAEREGPIGILCLLTDAIDMALVQQLPNLAWVSSVSVGVDHVDVAALTARGIPLGHTPGVLVDATADLTFALLLSAARRVGQADRFVHEGRWLPDGSQRPS